MNTPLARPKYGVTTAVALLLAAGCAGKPDALITAQPGVPLAHVAAVDLSSATTVRQLTGPVELEVPRNGWAGFALRLRANDPAAAVALRLPTFAACRAYQVLPAPVDFDRAGYVRQTGGVAGVRRVPRVLLPLPTSADGGSGGTGTGTVVNLTDARDPDHPTDPNGRAGTSPVLVWVDVHVPADAKPGRVAGSCDVIDAKGTAVEDRVAVNLTVADLTLPAAPALAVAAPMEWAALSAGSPGVFEGVTPRLLSRTDPAHAAAVATLDGYARLAHENRVSAYVPRLQPVVKWPPDAPPVADWSDFDAVAGPWLDGTAFADRVPAPYWPLPAPDALPGFDLKSRAQYWHVAAGHFAGRRWVTRSPVVLADETNRPAGPGTFAGDVSDAGAILLSTEARQALAADPAARALVPAREDQVLLSTVDDNPAYVAPVSAGRVVARAAGLVYPSRIRDWPAGVRRPDHWVDAADLTPATEQDVRAVGWLAYLRDASVVLCRRALPTPADCGDAARPVPVSDLVWFYPGHAYGVDGPLATLQLKWVRQAEQDYECLTALARRGGGTTAEVDRTCRLVVRPLEVLPGQPVDPTFDLFAGTADGDGCDAAGRLLLDRFATPAGPAGAAGSVADMNVKVRAERWNADHRQPDVVARGVRWTWNVGPDAAATPVDAPGQWITGRVDVDVYDPADEPAADAALQWTAAPDGWQVRPQPTPLPPVAAFHVRRATAVGLFNLNRVEPPVAGGAAAAAGPVTLALVRPDHTSAACPVTLPVAAVDRRVRPLALDGSLADWDATEAVHLDQPLVPALDRPAVQSPARPPAAGPPASVYAAWSDDDLYVAFKLAGVTAAPARATRNFVDYQSGRGWGEDLCELLVQPVYADNTLGPTLHVVAKPGGEWVERKPAPRPGSTDAAAAGGVGGAGDWQTYEGSAVRYARDLGPDGTWRGELAIPWRSIALPGRGRPELLRFNLAQHRQLDGQTASWAGPVDASRDDRLMGLLLVRDAAKP